MKEERYTNLILEEMRRQFKAVMEIVGDSNERIKDLPTRDEFDGLKADVAAIKLALTDTNTELRTLSTDHKATGSELALLERRVAKLKQKAA